MDKKKTISIIVMVIGLVTLVVGAVFLVLKLNAGAGKADGEYLVSAGEWVLDNDTSCNSSEKTEEVPEGDEAKAEKDSDSVDCESSVIWKFTEIGKGTLTTNGHKNDYDFQWALQDDKMIIKTEWLYELDNEYRYTLNQEDGILTLESGGKEYRFASQQ